MADTRTPTTRSPRRTRRGRAPCDRGSATVEMTLVVVPMMVLLGMFVAVCAREASAAIDVHAAASDAARAASLARTPGAASAAAQATAATSLTAGRLTCAGLQVSVDTSQFHRGGSVGVTIACAVALRDLGVPGLPGSRVVSATAASPLDVYSDITSGP